MRFSSHVLLQYLIQKHNVKIHRIQQEMTKYYGQPQFEVKATPKGKVTAVAVIEGQKRPPVPKTKDKPASKPRPPVKAKPAAKPVEVKYKRKRIVINKNTDGI